jgi:hypothetical protein
MQEIETVRFYIERGLTVSRDDGVDGAQADLIVEIKNGVVLWQPPSWRGEL